MRYLKAAFAGLAVGAVLAAAVLKVEMVHAQRVVASQIQSCHPEVASAVCGASVQFGGGEVPLVFALGYCVTFAWVLWRSRLQ